MIFKINLLKFLPVILPFFLVACGQVNEKKMGLLPSAKGDAGEVLLVIDSTKWDGDLGQEVKKVFLDRIEGLPQPEPMFSIFHVDPTKFQGFLRQHKNIVIISTFESQTAGSKYLKQFFTKESLDQIMRDTSVFMTNSTDEYSKGQHIMNLFSKDDKTLIKHLRKNKSRIQDIFNKVERKRLIGSLQKARKKTLEASLQEKHDFKIMLPEGYKLAKDSANFIWLRFPEYDFDKNLIITYKNYTSEDAFELENIIGWRDEIARKHTKDPDNPNYYVITEQNVPISERTITLDGKYAVEARGLWRLKERYVGGPFLSYTFVDQESNRLYYIEGFVSAPSGKKREYMREIEAILKTFQG